MAPRKYTEARKNGNRQWDKANLDRVSIAMAKGRKDEIKAHAEARGESLNKFINRAIDETMQRDQAGQSGPQAPQRPAGSDEK